MESLLPALACVAFLAGFLDSIVGGGGLIQLPGILALVPQISVATACGTNKFASICGTCSAALRYSREVKLPWVLILPTAIAAFVGSGAGALTLIRVPNDFLRPLVLAMLVVMVVYTYRKKDFGLAQAASVTPQRGLQLKGICLGGVIGFYDGFFGPGTGTFLIFLMVRIFRFDFLTASASAKVINVGTNLSAGLILIAGGHVFWRAALLMAAANVAGSVLGAQVAISRGSAFVRRLFLIVVTALILKLTIDL